MQRYTNLPHDIRNVIAGFGEPNFAWMRILPNGHKRWLMGWKDLGVSATWEEFSGGTTMLNTCTVKLQDAIWQGHESVFNHIFDVNSAWDGEGVRAG